MKNDKRLWAPISNIITTGCVVGSLLACNQPFDPRGSLQRQLVVFSILSTDRDVQLVRVEQNYMPTDFDALAYTADNSVANALVTVRDGGITFRLRDTTLPRSDTSRFKLPLRAYVLDPWTAVYGRSYEITVQSSQFPLAFATVSLPTKPSLAIDLSSTAVVDDPEGHKEEADILFPVVLGYGTKGYIGRFYVDYVVLKGNEWVEERVEVPLRYQYFDIRDLNYALYGTLTPCLFSNRVVGAYKNELFRDALKVVAYKKYLHSKIIFNRVVFQLVQVEQNLYKYYQVAHASNDPHSMRLDEPMYSNLVGGVGVVGAYTLDSLVHLLPENFAFNNKE